MGETHQSAPVSGLMDEEVQGVWGQVRFPKEQRVGRSRGNRGKASFCKTAFRDPKGEYDLISFGEVPRYGGTKATQKKRLIRGGKSSWEQKSRRSGTRGLSRTH